MNKIRSILIILLFSIGSCFNLSEIDKQEIDNIISEVFVETISQPTKDILGIYLICTISDSIYQKNNSWPISVDEINEYLSNINKTDSIFSASMLDSLSYDIVEFKESESKDLNIYFRGKNRPTKIILTA